MKMMATGLMCWFVGFFINMIFLFFLWFFAANTSAYYLAGTVGGAAATLISSWILERIGDTKAGPPPDDRRPEEEKMKEAEKEKLLKEFRRWFFEKDVNKTDKELLKYYGGKSYGWDYFITWCAGYFAGKKEAAP